MTPKERAAMQQALEALHNTQNALLFVSGNIEQFIISNMTADAHDDADKAITALREALAEQPTHKFIPVGIVNDQHCITWMEEIVDDQAPIGSILYAKEQS